LEREGRWGEKFWDKMGEGDRQGARVKEKKYGKK